MWIETHLLGMDNLNIIFSHNLLKTVKNMQCSKWLWLIIVVVTCNVRLESKIDFRTIHCHAARMTLLTIIFFSRNKRNVRILQFNIKAYCIYLQVKLCRLHLLESEEKWTKTKKQNNQPISSWKPCFDIHILK